MKLNYFKSKLFQKYTWSYLFMLLVPLALLSVFIYNSAVRNLRSEIEQSHLNQLTQAKTIVDSHVKQLSDIASRVAYDDQLARYRVHDPYYSLEAINALKNYKATSPIIGEMFLYFHGDERIYSTAGMTSLDVFHERYHFLNWEGSTLVEELNSVKFPVIHSTEMLNQNGTIQHSVLAYLVPITPNNPNPHGTLMYLIPKSELTRLIDTILGNYEGSSYIFDNHGRVMASKNNQEQSLQGSDLQQLVALSTGIHSIEIGGVSHSVVSVKSETNGWEYVTLMPSSQFLDSVMHLRSLMILLLAVLTVVGTLAALILARRQLHPILDLVKFADSKSKPGVLAAKPHKTGNELDRIRTALQEYSSRADLQEPYARNHFLLMLLKYGNARSLMPELLSSLEINLNKAHYFAMVIGRDEAAKSRLNTHDWQAMIGRLAAAEIPEYGACLYSVELPKPGQIALIVGFDKVDSWSGPDQFRRIVHRIHDNLLEQFRIDPVIGVGTYYSDPDQLNQSFIEACSAFESRMFTGHGSITFFEKLSHAPGETSWVPKNELLKLSQSLKQGSYEVAAQTIGESMKVLQNPELSVEMKRCISFDILNTILRTGMEMDIRDWTYEIPSSDAFNSLQELERHFLGLASRICELALHNERKEEHSLMDRIIAYIDSNYMDHSLSLEAISCKYSISVSHFSRSFKDQMGINFVQYIWQKRMMAVMNDLTSTNDPLKDIIQRVGYLDTPNFIRKFKKETGLTPGQYRKLYSQVESSNPPISDSADVG
ncbi:helix-turn-helix domain-containing protein [Paenibacillus phoenicis]|uniref:Helix-turn-helix domain-containing protein n=1 Tax=Paenibacillus phoenicis TaxID=554117 RepID=A0ABU5PFC0_9BACL|nr:MULTISPECIES: helix-turn-helix domain-containing protein [Paenibacillus]EES73635.1 transcriptional regulator, AraC family [Paenibacillus sp. oral taxon 786 str. D14]MCT2193650.1 helix-turn-helix domain-containing protein [Paenibacillus sp. p3-SID1389]MEA3568457.1 helix-turn-helix domain-containing protein [Paenibacillus phoenicis]